MPVSVTSAASAVRAAGARVFEGGQVRGEKFRMLDGKENSVLHLRGVGDAVSQSRYSRVRIIQA